MALEKGDYVSFLVDKLQTTLEKGDYAPFIVDKLKKTGPSAKFSRGVFNFLNLRLFKKYATIVLL